MKTHIDTIHQAILQDLGQEAPTDIVLASVIAMHGIDGLSKARVKRETLIRWSIDPFLSRDERDYATLRLESLPSF